MKIIADLHIHSKFSRATSYRMDFENLWLWGKYKGINLLGTGDFTHPGWFSEIKEKFQEKDGFLSLKEKKEPPFFVISGEISCIYKKKGRQRRIHLLILVPSFEIALLINQRLSLKGNLYSDGRPILGMDAKELAEFFFDISEEIFIIPAHIWTPWYSLYGSNSGFDSIGECFEDLSSKIKAVETGLSSDPPMNWRVAELDNKAIVSFSDSHSPEKIGREATVFDIEPNFKELYLAMSFKNSNKILFTLEFYPEEGKYHFTGHRNCGIVYSPQETKEKGKICPKCKKPLTIGVMDRVETLADRKEGFVDSKRPGYKNLVPLLEIISEAKGGSGFNKKSESLYFQFINLFGGEFNVLLDVPFIDLKKVDEKIAEGILRVREGRLKINPGYDGTYGKVEIWGEKEEKNIEIQQELF